MLVRDCAVIHLDGDDTWSRSCYAVTETFLFRSRVLVG